MTAGPSPTPGIGRSMLRAMLRVFGFQRALEEGTIRPDLGPGFGRGWGSKRPLSKRVAERRRQNRAARAARQRNRRLERLRA